MNEHMSLASIFGSRFYSREKEGIRDYKILSPKEYGMSLQRKRKRKRK
jgi:hypothetical protein